jgi:PAS domain S-box-containing protein
MSWNPLDGKPELAEHSPMDRFGFRGRTLKTLRPNSPTARHPKYFAREQLEACRRPRLILIFGVLLLLQISAASQVKPIRRVLILYEVGTSHPGVNIIDNGIRTALQNSPFHLELYTEYMDSMLFPDPADQQRFRDFYISKYRNRQPDVIITVGPTPLKFMWDAHQRAFRGVPIIFCFPNGAVPGAPALDSDFTGVETAMAPAETMKVALRLQPDTEHVVVVIGTTGLEKQEEAIVREQLKKYEGRLDISYLTNLAMPAVLDRLRRLSSHTVVLFVGLDKDGAGTQFISGSESAPMVAAAANAPVFGLYDVYLNHGEVGGDLASLMEQGKIAGGMALRILSGEKPQDIPRARDVTAYMFDWRALQRWGFKEKNLPPGSIVLNRQSTVWESYKWYIMGGISLIVLQALLISGLVWHRARLKKTEAELASALEVAQESEQRFRLVANTAPVMIWMAGVDKLRNYFNQPWLHFTGRSLVTELGNGWSENVYPEDVQMCLNTYTHSFDRREPFTMQYRVRRRDGEYRWVLDTGVPRFNFDDSFTGYIGSCIDITDHKRAEEALSSVSRRLIDAQEQERTRIARELHDDINQRIAMLGIELDVLQQSLPNPGAELQSRLDELRQLTSDIGTEVQAISHRLHSSKLEYLGLVAACKSFCKEVADWHKVDVNFAAENIPSTQRQDVALCLFRVLQESLNNAIKHSGAQRFEVRLRGTVSEIQLTVRDHGIGFDAAAAIISRGLGLISMRERISLVNGTILIASKPMGGTEISARVPVVAKSASQTASGAA